MKHIRTWLFLPYADGPPHAIKLVFDYFLLLFASRQLRVFNVEKTRGDTYPGGSNSEDIGSDWETPSFVNPVPDFLGYVGLVLNYLTESFVSLLFLSIIGYTFPHFLSRFVICSLPELHHGEQLVVYNFKYYTYNLQFKQYAQQSTANVKCINILYCFAPASISLDNSEKRLRVYLHNN